MKNFTVLVVLAFLVFLGVRYVRWDPEGRIQPPDTAVPSPESAGSEAAGTPAPPATDAAAQPPEAPASVETPAEEPQRVEIVCPLCRGEGVLIRRVQPPSGAPRETRYACPVCLGKGTRRLEIPPGHRLCPDCHGWGSKSYVKDKGGGGRQSGGRTATTKEGPTYAAYPCARCVRKGYIRAPGGAE